MAFITMAWAGETLRFNVSDQTVVQYLVPVFPPQCSITDLERSIEASLTEIELHLMKADRPVLLVEDPSRPSDTAPLVEAVVRRVSARRDSNRPGIRVVIAAGAHYDLKSADVHRKIGSPNVPVIVHDCLDQARLCRIGESPNGIPLWFNRDVVDADLRLAISTVNIHPLAGYSGGGKILLPGVAGLKTIAAFHGLPRGEAGVYRNAMRELIDDALAKLPLDYTWQLLSRPEDGSIFGMAFGEVQDAHNQAIRGLNAIVSLPKPGFPADLVLAGCRPFNQNLVGTFKSLNQLPLLTRPGGMIVLFNETFQGTGAHHWRNQPEVVRRQKEYYAKVFAAFKVWVYAPAASDEDFQALFPETFRLVKSFSELNRELISIRNAVITVVPFAPITLVASG